MVVAPTISRESEGRLRFDAASPSATGTLVVQPAASIAVGSEWLTSLSESQARAVVLDSLEPEEGETQTLSIQQELMSSYRSLLLSATNGVALASAVRWGVVERTPSIILVAAKQPLREPIALACSESSLATPSDSGSPPQPTFSPPRTESSEKSGLLDVDVKLDYYEPKPGWVATGDEDGGGAGAMPASEAGMGRNLILTLGVAAGLMLAAGMMRLRQVRLEMDPTCTSTLKQMHRRARSFTAVCVFRSLDSANVAVASNRCLQRRLLISLKQSRRSRKLRNLG